jgi:hypothetical protein
MWVQLVVLVTSLCTEGAQKLVITSVYPWSIIVFDRMWEKTFLVLALLMIEGRVHAQPLQQL